MENMEKFIRLFKENKTKMDYYFGQDHDGQHVHWALKYSLRNQTFNSSLFREQEARLADFDEIKLKTGVNTSLIMSLMLEKVALKELAENDRRLEKVGFKNSLARLEAAQYLSNNVSHETAAKSLYDELNRQKIFKNSMGLISLSVFWGETSKDSIENELAQYKEITKKVHNKKILRGPQFVQLCVFLTARKKENIDKFIDLICRVKLQLKQEMKITSRHNLQIGVVALLFGEMIDYEEIQQLYKLLLQQPGLSLTKNQATTIALQYVIARHQNGLENSITNSNDTLFRWVENMYENFNLSLDGIGLILEFFK